MRATSLHRRTPLRSKTPLGRGTPLRAGKPLARRAPLPKATSRLETSRPRRKTPLRQVNPERAAKMEARNFGPHAKWIRRQPCVVSGCRSKAQACHLEPRKMGGCGSSWRSLFPACFEHHREQEGKTSQFETRYGLRLAVIVEQMILADSWPSEDEKAAARERLTALEVTHA